MPLVSLEVCEMDTTPAMEEKTRHVRATRLGKPMSRVRRYQMPRATLAGA